MAEPARKKLQSYRELLVWQKSMDLVVGSCELAKKLPQSELFSLSDQIRRAAVSIPANIAEGYGRWNSRDYMRYLRIASGSLTELETHFLIGVRLKYLSRTEVESILTKTDELGRMLTSLLQKLAIRNP